MSSTVLGRLKLQYKPIAHSETNSIGIDGGCLSNIFTHIVNASKIKKPTTLSFDIMGYTVKSTPIEEGDKTDTDIIRVASYIDLTQSG